MKSLGNLWKHRLTNFIIIIFFLDIGREAAEKALNDAGIDYNMVDAAVVSHVYGESTSGIKDFL